MIKETDLNKIAKLERAIEKKYGKEATYHPRREWDADDEKNYEAQLEEFLNKLKSIEEKSTFELGEDIYMQKREHFNEKRTCVGCLKYSFDLKDEYYLIKYDCCFNCYVKYVEDREARWLNGWRPDKGK